MQKHIRMILLILCITIFLSALPITASAENIVSGYCGGEGDGTNITWELTDEGELIISGTGAMAAELYKALRRD